MKKLLTIFFLFGFLFINHCSKSEKIEISEIKNDQIEDQMIKAYQEGMDAFEDKLYIEAAKRCLTDEIEECMINRQKSFNDNISNIEVYDEEEL